MTSSVLLTTHTADSNFWLKFIVFLSILAVILLGFDFLMKKLLKVRKTKGKLFSYGHVNDKHKKLDWTLRITAIILMIFGYFYNTLTPHDEWLFYLEAWFVLLVFIGVSSMLQAYMEWKYAEDRKLYIYTIAQLLFIAILVTATFSTDFFGFFS